MRLQVQVLLSVASGSLVPSVRGFVPAGTSSVGRLALPTVSRFTCHLRSRSTSSAASSITLSRRSLTRLASKDNGISGSGGGRASAAVLQDEERRAEATASGEEAAETLDLKPPRGTRDVFPEDMRLRNWLFGHWRQVALSFGFEEYDAPVLESEGLYVRKSGEEVTQQLYNFEDKGGRRVSLRPEMTPSLARMVMSKRKSLNLPVKWFSVPQCWRYERMTRGRRREHYQWNMDIWGVQGVEAEAELLGAIVTFFERVGLGPEDVGIKVNSRGVLTGVLRSLGVPEEKHTATCVLVDKLDKVPVDAISGELQALGLEESSIKRLVEVMEIRDMEGVERVLGKDEAPVQQLGKLFDLAASYGFSEWLVLDCSVVRGLAYYTGTVFEAFDRRGKLRAICGGGRYDSLLKSFGGEALPAAGFGFGDAVIVELLSDKGLLPPDQGPGVTAVVFAFDSELQVAATTVARDLRRAGLSVDLVLETRKPKVNFRHADRLQAAFVVIVAPSEWAQEKVSVKNMRTGQQEALSVTDAVRHIVDGVEGISDG